MEDRTSHTSKNPIIMDCSCKHPYQDKRYGKGKRLHNPAKDHGWRCTVCGKTVTG